MKQKDVVIGATYETRIGESLARVVVVAEVRTETRSRYGEAREVTRYRLRRQEESGWLPKLRTAAALRPCPRTPLTKTQVRTLQENAGRAGDLMGVIVCAMALGASRDEIRAEPAWADVAETAFDRWPTRAHAIQGVREMIVHSQEKGPLAVLEEKENAS
jgi:hypothetical protein